MDYGRMVHFLTVVDLGTVTAAAAALHLTQPALSRQLKALERDLGLQLFELHGNRLELTAAGRSFVPLARDLVARTRGVREAVDILKSGRVAQLVLAATSASVRSFVAPFIATTTTDDPVLLTRTASHFELDITLHQDADLIVSPAPRAEGLSSVDLGDSPLKAYVAPSHRWAERDQQSVGLTELCGEHLLVHSRASVSRGVLDTALGRSRLSPAQMTECDDGPTIQALAVSGHGVAITTELPRFEARPLPVVDEDGALLSVPLHVAWLPDHVAADTIAELGLRLRSFLRGQNGHIAP